MRCLRVLAVLALTLGVAQGAERKDFAGTWVAKLGERNLFVLKLTIEGEGMGGVFERPMQLSSTNGTFTNMRGGVRRDKVVQSAMKDGNLHFKTRNANDAKDEDAYVMTIHGDRAELSFDDLPPSAVMAPLLLERSAASATVSTDWEPNRLYVSGDSDVSNAEMKAIFDEDQRVRMSDKIDWNIVGKSDAERRQQTRKLLADGALHTGQDYEEAAFVFQHGDSAADYLLAHTLAMVAVSKGDATAIWIAAATLDRYLENIGQKQIFGTQYSSDMKGHWTQEPYDRDLISDALRRQLGVPPQALQQERLKAYQSEK